MRTLSTSRRRVAALLTVAALAASVAAATPSSPSLAAAPAAFGAIDRVPSADRAVTAITINGFNKTGLPVVDTMGYDLKQPEALAGFTKTAADTLFGTSGAGLFNLVRIPVYAAEAHPGAGKVTGSRYAAHLAAVKRINGYQSRVKVFASLRLVGNYRSKEDGNPRSFPGWVKAGGHVDPAKYSQLLFDYLLFMDVKQDIEIDYLGIDNERYLNEGQLTPARYNSTVSQLKSRIKTWNKNHPKAIVKKPTFVASDNFRPDTEWVGALDSTPDKWSHSGVLGVHWYSKHRIPVKDKYSGKAIQDDLTSVANAAKAHRKPLWENEYHFNDDSLKNNEYRLDVRGILGATDNFDRGTSGFTWWSYNHYCAGGKRNQWCDSSPRARLETRIAQTTYGARILPAPTDRDGTGNARGALEKGFVTRAFRRGSVVSVWIINNTDAAYANQVVRVPGFNVPAGYTAPLQQWRRTATSGTDNISWQAGKARPSDSENVVRVTVPARSITILQLPAVAVS